MMESDLSARLDALELKLDMILEALGVTGAAPSDHHLLEEEARTLLANGRKIEAIKIWRERTGVGLREAKEAVERL